MSKIIVPQELQDKIVDLYVNKGYGRMKIKKELHLDFGDTIIKRILQENNIHIRNFNEAKVGCYKTEVPQEIQKQIIELYQKGYGLDKIVKELSLPFSFDKVRSILQDNGIHIRNLQEASLVKQMPELRKYTVNDDYVLESHNGAWLLGFIAADGYLPITKGAKNRITITLQEQDEEILQRIAKELEYNGPIYHFENQGFPAVSLSFSSQKLRQQIENYGIGNNKTFKLSHIPNLPNEYKLDFIRGFFDGDGSLYEPKGKKININFTCASETFLKDITKFFFEEYGINEPKIHSQERVHIIYTINYYVKNSLTICNAFYNNDYLSLARKKEHFFTIKKKYNLP
jgi:intein-encoded DNA endonuclease-like protein